MTETTLPAAARPRGGRQPTGESEATRIGVELRESERAVHYWRQKVAQFGGPPPLMALELTRMFSRDWSHRFLISTDPAAENHAFLIYGHKLARLLDLPEEAVRQVPMIEQLPERYVPVFVDGCGEAVGRTAPIRKTGVFERWDGQIELYRVAFMPVAVRPNSLTTLVYGAFNRRLVHKVMLSGAVVDRKEPA